MHIRPPEHGPQRSPPQSTSVSVPFRTPSEHDTHVPLSQRPDRQSPGTVHVLPSSQPGHSPPQSTPTSPPSIVPFVQLALRQ
jgi:hypothetical protein